VNGFGAVLLVTEYIWRGGLLIVTLSKNYTAILLYIMYVSWTGRCSILLHGLYSSQIDVKVYKHN
jgi:hypothetical protein